MIEVRKKLARSGERGDYSPDSSNWVFYGLATVDNRPKTPVIITLSNMAGTSRVEFRVTDLRHEGRLFDFHIRLTYPPEKYDTSGEFPSSTGMMLSSVERDEQAFLGHKMTEDAERTEDERAIERLKKRGLLTTEGFLLRNFDMD